MEKPWQQPVLRGGKEEGSGSGRWRVCQACSDVNTAKKADRKRVENHYLYSRRQWKRRDGVPNPGGGKRETALKPFRGSDRR